MSKEQALEELLKMIKEGNITDYDAELASYRDEKYVFWEASLNLNQVFRQIQLKPDFEVGDNPNSAPIRCFRL